MKFILPVLLLFSTISQASYRCEIECISKNNKVIFVKSIDPVLSNSDYEQYCRDLGGDAIWFGSSFDLCVRNTVICEKHDVITSNKASMSGEDLVLVKSAAKNECLSPLKINHDCKSRMFEGVTAFTGESCTKY